MSDVFVFSLVATIQSPKVYYRITVDSVSVQRRIVQLQSNRVLRDVHPFIGRVVPKTIVIQACFTIFILPLVAKRTIIQRTSCEGTKFSVDVKLPLRSIKPRNLLVGLFSVGFRCKNSERQGIYPCLYTFALKLITVYSSYYRYDSRF